MPTARLYCKVRFVWIARVRERRPKKESGDATHRFDIFGLVMGQRLGGVEVRKAGCRLGGRAFGELVHRREFGSVVGGRRALEGGHWSELCDMGVGWVGKRSEECD
jgi:hypothetical protein